MSNGIQTLLAGLHQSGVWISKESKSILLLVLGVNAGLILWTNRVTFQDFKNSGDEYSYLISARLFAEGRLSVPSPEPREAFALNQVINDGDYFGKYPPGWPLLLAVGVKAGLSWLVNPLLGLLTLWGLCRLGNEYLPTGSGSLALLTLLGNPYFILNSASYFSHPSCLLFLTLAWLLGFKALKNPGDWRPATAFALAAGVAFCIRPLTALLFLLPVFIMLGKAAWRTGLRGQDLKAKIGGLLVLTLMAAVFLSYNVLQTGDLLTQPYQRYDPRDGLGMNANTRDWSWALRFNILDRILELNRWLPLSMLLALAFGIFHRKIDSQASLWLSASAGCLIVGHVVVLYHPGNQYGPRYSYEVLGVLALLSATVLGRFPALVVPSLVLILGLNGTVLWKESRVHHDQIRERQELYNQVRAAGIQRGIIFLRTGTDTMLPEDLTRNGIHFADEPVLFVHDRGSLNARVLERFPGRPPYLYELDPASGRRRLVSLQGPP